MVPVAQPVAESRTEPGMPRISVGSRRLAREPTMGRSARRPSAKAEAVCKK